MRPIVSLVAAVARNGVIAATTASLAPVERPEAVFKALTMGKPMLMGRRTWDSIGRPLPGRRTLVLTRDRGFRAEGTEVVHDWEAALAAAAGTELMVVGGAEIYALALPQADRLYLTEVDAEPEGDVRFPAFDRAGSAKPCARRIRARATSTPSRSWIGNACAEARRRICLLRCACPLPALTARGMHRRCLSGARAHVGPAHPAGRCARAVFRPSARADRGAICPGGGTRRASVAVQARGADRHVGRARTGGRRRLGCLGAIRAAAEAPGAGRRQRRWWWSVGQRRQDAAEP